MVADHVEMNKYTYDSEEQFQCLKKANKNHENKSLAVFLLQC